MLSLIGLIIVNQSSLQRKVTMQERHLCFPSYFFTWPCSAPTHFFHSRIATVQCIQGTLCFSGQAQVAKNPECKRYIQYREKFQGKLCFSGQAQVDQKLWMIKNIYSIQWIQGTLYFSGQVQVAKKSWMVKNIFNTVKNFRANSIFQGKRKLLKIPEW